MAEKKFGIYVHIPYCLQRCSYCDFATFEWSQIRPPHEYVELVKTEIRRRAPLVPYKTVDTIYFGGGTPSLIEAPLIVAILEELANCGFQTRVDAEITIEINPATMDENKLRIYQSSGINRFSVGAQTFNDALLKSAGRKHSAEDTASTLEFLNSRGLNYSFDLLFALPKQSLDMLRFDLERVAHFRPPHLSAYCLTVPESHPMQTGRAPDDEQIAMFGLIEESLAAQGLNIYEISNFAHPGKESRHNLLYWTDQNYWGLGLSAHSYFSEPGWGARFWNPNTWESYEKSLAGELNAPLLSKALPEKQKEVLHAHQSLTDFCHTALRLTQGLDVEKLREKFSLSAPLAESRLDRLEKIGFLQRTCSGFRIEAPHRTVSNRIFEELTFLPEDLN